MLAKIEKYGVTVLALAAIAISTLTLSTGLITTSHKANQAYDQATVSRETDLVFCEGGNELRRGLRQYFHSQLIESERFDPSILHISPEQYAELRAKSEAKLLYDIQQRFGLKNCDKYKEE